MAHIDYVRRCLINWRPPWARTMNGIIACARALMKCHLCLCVLRVVRVMTSLRRVTSLSTLRDVIHGRVCAVTVRVVGVMFDTVLTKKVLHCFFSEYRSQFFLYKFYETFSECLLVNSLP